MGIQPRSKLMWYTFSKPLRRFFTLLVVLVLACVIYEACLLIYSAMLNVSQWTVSQAAPRGKYKPIDEVVVNRKTGARFPESSYGQRYGRHDVESINLQMRQLYMKKPFLDSRLVPINFTILPKALLCSEVDFVVMVHVRAEDAPSRNYWRNTYGDRVLKNQFNYSILFSIGKPSTLSDQKKIEVEALECGDILQTDYKDTYRNLTFKHLAELRYLLMTCPKNVVVVKMDDDIALNVQRMSTFIKNNLNSEELYCPSGLQQVTRNNAVYFQARCCSYPKKWIKVINLLAWEVLYKSLDSISPRMDFFPLRICLRKFVSMEEWNKSMYPSYCWAWCYVAPLIAVERIISVAHSQRFFWIDDVFITGVLREAANVSITDVRQNNDLYYYKGRQSATRAAKLSKRRKIIAN